jgi:ABC-2 type transport system ATP-binding protein
MGGTVRAAPGEAGEPAVSIRGLVKRYGPVTAVDDLDLDVLAGECFGLLGPNGAGKTTTLDILTGLLPPTAGEVRVLGRRWGEDDRLLRSRMGVAFQEALFPNRLTVAETLALFRSFYPAGRDERSVIREIGLSDKADTWTSRLSGGQRQRLALGAALVGDPELLILDEPTTGLDPQARLLVGDHILSYRDRRRTVIVSTHYMDEAQRLCDRVAIVDHGKVIAQGTPAGLVASLGGALLVEFSLDGGDIEEEAIRSVGGVRAVRRSGAAFQVAAAEPQAAVPALFDLVRRRSATINGLTIRQATLEDVFLSLTGRRLRDG